MSEESKRFEPGTLDLDYIEDDMEDFESIAKDGLPGVGLRARMRMITAVGWLDLLIKESRILRARIKELEQKKERHYEAALPRRHGSGCDGGLR